MDDITAIAYRCRDNLSMIADRIKSQDNTIDSIGIKSEDLQEKSDEINKSVKNITSIWYWIFGLKIPKLFKRSEKDYSDHRDHCDHRDHRDRDHRDRDHRDRDHRDSDHRDRNHSDHRDPDHRDCDHRDKDLDEIVKMVPDIKNLSIEIGMIIDRQNESLDVVSTNMEDSCKKMESSIKLI